MLKRPLLAVVVLVMVAVLFAVAIVAVPILTHRSAGGSGQDLASTAGHTVTAHGADGRTRTLTVTTVAGEPAQLQQLQPGEKLVVTGSGYDAGIGIYVSFCKLAATVGGRPGPCLGDIPASPELAEAVGDTALASAWVSDDLLWRQFATARWQSAANGEFRVELLVPTAASNGVDCAVDSCALVTRADHTAAKDRVQDLALPISFATR